MWQRNVPFHLPAPPTCLSFPTSPIQEPWGWGGRTRAEPKNDRSPGLFLAPLSLSSLAGCFVRLDALLGRPGRVRGRAAGGSVGAGGPSVIWKSAALAPAAVPSRKRSLINAKSPGDYRTRKSNDFIVRKVYCRRGATGRRIICHLLERAAGIVRRCRAGGTEPPQEGDTKHPSPPPRCPPPGEVAPGGHRGR